jgi:hypothetical protein
MLLAAGILNRIADTTPLRHRWAQLLFLMTQEQLTKQRESQEKALAERGFSTPVILAYLSLAPLLAENEAISQYIEKTGNLDLRAALPEVTTENEAQILAIKEYGLNQSQQAQLKELLLALT